DPPHRREIPIYEPSDRIDHSDSSDPSDLSDPSDFSDLPATSDTDPIIETTVVPEIETAETFDTDAYDPTAELSHYRFPSLDLLQERIDNQNPIDEAEQEENRENIRRSLQSYGVEIASIHSTVGPTITLYEIVPAEGVRISKIKRLGDDMAMSLAAIGIRIIAPMPGKGTIGMEVPNKRKRVVSIRSILSSKAYHESTADLPIAMGVTIDNNVYVADLAKMPHLLVAGATGQGKSVGLNTIITSIIYKKHPAEVKFVLVDPKMVEFSLYRCLERHFLAKLPDEEKAVITDPLKVVATLSSLCIEMDNRYELLSLAGVRDLKEYNKKFISRRLNPEKGHRFMPYIIVVIDEFADLIIQAGKEVENPISRIAAKARAVGIHMILATQRPSVNVITGTIKANFPGRMAFRVTQMNDSRTILDRPGAEQLIGKGDMLISRDGVIDRVQCAFIDTDEVERVCESISSQQGYATAYELPDAPADDAGGGTPGDPSGALDSLFEQAGRMVIAQGQCSTTGIQRSLSIGFPRAGKIVDQLCYHGVVGPANGAKMRDVLMDIIQFEDLLIRLKQ
ncbi:MAG: DNA translocase FtsK, partial [Paramuribaculum sp.]|nr:DNA translocase FtsK [Paramuribaculum sp.]